MDSYYYLGKILECENPKDGLNLQNYENITKLMDSIDGKFKNIKNPKLALGAAVQAGIISEQINSLNLLKNSELTEEKIFRAADLLAKIESKCEYFDVIFSTYI